MKARRASLLALVVRGTQAERRAAPAFSRIAVDDTPSPTSPPKGACTTRAPHRELVHGMDPYQCFILRGPGRMKSACSLVAASSTMLSSMCAHTAAEVYSAAVASPRQLSDRVRSEAAATSLGADCCSRVSFAGGGIRVENRGFQVLPPSRSYVALSEAAAAFSPGGATSSSRSAGTSAAGAVAGQFIAEPPSASTGEYYENEYAAREAVLEYLKSREIDIAELESVALPPSVAIMEERITFLRKIGLSTKDINDYPLMVGCSVKKNLVPVLSYLEKLNVEAKFLPDLIRRYPMVLNASVTMDLEPAISFLMGIGIDRLNLGRVLTRYPEVLGFKIEGTMSTSVAYLVSLGVNMREIGPMITEYPEILGMRVGNNIKPKVEYLLGLGIPKEVLAKVFEVKPFILGFDLEETIKPAIENLKALGVREDRIAGVVIQYADALGLDINHRLEPKVGWLVKHAGVKREDIGLVLERMPQILAINIALAQSRVTFLSREGFSVEDLGTMVTQFPQILALSVDDVLKPHLSFFVNNIKRPLSELVSYPFYFAYDLDKRIRPRFLQIEEEGVQCSLSWFLNCSDAKFADRLQLDLVERPEQEETEPLATIGGRMRIKGDYQSVEVPPEEDHNSGDRVRIRQVDSRDESPDQGHTIAAES